MFDAVEMMRKTWSGMNLPSSLQPTMDLAEIDRRIADLRVVEQWLQLNQTMLQTTIQTLEIQRNTVAAFQAFSKAGTMVASTPTPSPPSNPAPSHAPSSSAGPRPASEPAAANPPGSSIAAAQAALWWDFLQQPFRQLTEAASRQSGFGPVAGSGDPSSHAPSGPSGDPSSAFSGSQPAAGNPATNPADPPPASNFGPGVSARSSSTESADGLETPNQARAPSTKGSRR